MTEAFNSQAFMFGCFSVIFLILFLDGIKLRHVLLSEFFLYACLVTFGYYWLYIFEDDTTDFIFLMGALVGILSSVLWLRYGVLYWDKLAYIVSSKSLINPDRHSDIRRLLANDDLPNNQYNPWLYFKIGKHFMGLDEQLRPFYLDQLPHGFYAGTTGSGKGNALQSHAAQSVMNDEALIYLDPKNDKFAPHALYSACQKYQRSYRYISVGSDQPAQINVLAGANRRELTQLLQNGFVLTDKNTDGDHHRGNDRKAARQVAALIHQYQLTLAEAFDRVCDEPFFQQKAAGFLEKLEAVAHLAAINAKTNKSVLNDLIQSGGAIYVQGSMDEEVERVAQRFILIRTVQIASARNRLESAPRMVCVIADEVRFQMSRQLLNILSAGRDKSIRALLAFQSMVDLRSAESDLKPEVIEGIVLENTPVKHIYRIEDPQTAEWFAEKSGHILARLDSFESQKNLLMAERLTKSIVREDPTTLLSPDALTSSPDGWGVLFFKGRVTRLLIRSLPCALCNEAITVITQELSATPVSQNDPDTFFSMEDIDDRF